MTIEEAIKYLRMATDEAGNEEFSDVYKEMCSMSINALEKQIPKKPIAEPTDDTCLYYENYCPDCDKLLIAKHMHCPRCGQKLDW